MFRFKVLYFSLLLGALLNNNILMAQVIMPPDISFETAELYAMQKDYKSAMEWYLKAADKGCPVARSTIGIYYERGLGVKQDYQQAMRWLLKAADKGNAVAMDNVGYFYEKGLGVKQDQQLAEQWYQKAKQAKQ